MPPITDPQVARIMERVDHIAKSVDELKPLMAALVTLQAEHQHLADHMRQLNTVAELRGVAVHQIDKRVTVLERWQKGLVWFTGLALSVIMWLGGYVKQFTDSLDETNRNTQNRLAAMEFIINSPNFERAIEPERPVAAGGRK